MRRSSFDQMARSSWMRRFAQSLFLVLLSLLVSSHSVMAADKTNVLPNPGFEDGKSGWSQKVVWAALGILHVSQLAVSTS